MKVPHLCPECGGLMEYVRADCPVNEVGCGVAHFRAACRPCERKRWEEYDRPATIGELTALRDEIRKLKEEMGR